MIAEPVETYEVGDLTVSIEIDDDGSWANPRKWEFNVGEMVCWHPNYYLGDKQITDASGRGAVKDLFDRDHFGSLEVLRRYLGIVKKAVCILPLSVYDHSGLTMYVGGKRDFPFDSAGWDTTHVGFIYTTAERMAELGVEVPEPDVIEKSLRDEVKTYDLYLRGEVYGYVIKRGDEEVDACWGFLGFDNVKEAADEAAKGATAHATR